MWGVAGSPHERRIGQESRRSLPESGQAPTAATAYGEKRRALTRPSAGWRTVTLSPRERAGFRSVRTAATVGAECGAFPGCRLSRQHENRLATQRGFRKRVQENLSKHRWLVLERGRAYHGLQRTAGQGYSTAVGSFWEFGSRHIPQPGLGG